MNKTYDFTTPYFYGADGKILPALRARLFRLFKRLCRNEVQTAEIQLHQLIRDGNGDASLIAYLKSERADVYADYMQCEQLRTRIHVDWQSPFR